MCLMGRQTYPLRACVEMFDDIFAVIRMRFEHFTNVAIPNAGFQ